MKIIDEKLLDAFRGLTRCEWCFQFSSAPMHPHHVFAKGIGGAGRLDIEINLIGLCLWCHQSHHDGNPPTRSDCLAIIARRERTNQHAIEMEIYRLLRTPKENR